jgi:hypothetical protein
MTFSHFLPAVERVVTRFGVAYWFLECSPETTLRTWVSPVVHSTCKWFLRSVELRDLFTVTATSAARFPLSTACFARRGSAQRWASSFVIIRDPSSQPKSIFHRYFASPWTPRWTRRSIRSRDHQADAFLALKNMTGRRALVPLKPAHLSPLWGWWIQPFRRN